MPRVTFSTVFVAALLAVMPGSGAAVGAEPPATEQERAIRKARESFAGAMASHGAGDRRTLAAMSELVAAYLDAEDYAAAAPLARDLLASLERSTPRNDAEIAAVTGDMAQVAVGEGRLEDAETLFRRAVALAEEAAGGAHRATGLALNNLGSFLHDVNRSQEAEPIVRRALRIRERTLGPSDPLTAQTLCTLGVIALSQEDMLLAEALLRQSLTIRERADPPARRSDLAESQVALARLLLSTGRAGEAEAILSEASDHCREAFGPMHLRTLVAMHLRADALAATARTTESDRVHRELIAAIESLAPPRPGLLAQALGDYGRHLLAAGEAARALEVHRRAVAVSRTERGDDGGATIPLRRLLAESLYANALIDEAIAEGRDIVAVVEAADPRSLDTGAALVSLAKYLLAADGAEEARPMIRRAIGMLDETSGPSGEPTLRALSLLAMSFVAADELAEAEKVVDEAMDRYRAEPDIRSTEAIGEVIGLRGFLLRKAGRVDEAEEAEAVARRIEADRRR